MFLNLIGCALDLFRFRILIIMHEIDLKLSDIHFNAL